MAFISFVALLFSLLPFSTLASTVESDRIKKFRDIDANIKEGEKNALLFNTLLESSNWDALAKIKKDDPKTLSSILREIRVLVVGLYKKGVGTATKESYNFEKCCYPLEGYNKFTEDYIKEQDDTLVSKILGDITNVFIALDNVKGNEGDLRVTGDTGTLAKGLADILNKHLDVDKFVLDDRPKIECIKKASEGKTVETDDSNLIKEMIGDIDTRIDDDKKNILLFNTLLESSNWDALAKIKKDDPKTLSSILREIRVLVVGLYKKGVGTATKESYNFEKCCYPLEGYNKFTEDYIKEQDDTLVSKILGDITNVFIALDNVKGNEGDLRVTGDTGTLAKGLADILNKHLDVDKFVLDDRPKIECIKKASEGKTVETGGTPDVEPGEGSSNKPEIERMEKTSEDETVKTDETPDGKPGEGPSSKPSWEAWKIALLATSILIVIIVVIVIIYFFTKRK